MLKTDLDNGIVADDSELINRRNAFGSNTYPIKKGRSFLVCYGICFQLSRYLLFSSYFFANTHLWFLFLQRFLWEAWQDLTLIILMVAAVASLVLGIKTEVGFPSIYLMLKM